MSGVSLSLDPISVPWYMVTYGCKVRLFRDILDSSPQPVHASVMSEIECLQYKRLRAGSGILCRILNQTAPTSGIIGRPMFLPDVSG
jgi:hypothetical protein